MALRTARLCLLPLVAGSSAALASGDGLRPEPVVEPSQQINRADEASATNSFASIDVHLATQVQRMAGGIGASWHCMSHEFTFTNLTRDQRRSRGSGWGGNPPIQDAAAWKRVEALASWLGMDFMRVELEQNSYEPKRDAFDWSSDEMSALCSILDWCQKDGADVFLTQMWGNVDWNAYAGVSRVQSAPRDIHAFASGLATLIDYLVRHKHYTCIKWICINNEPTGKWAWWLGPGKKLLSITPALKAVRAELDKRGIAIPLSGPDDNNLGALKEGFDFNAWVGALDCHNYGKPDFNGMKRWAVYAHSNGKPFLLTEMGDRRAGPTTWNHAMSLANKIVLGLNAGVGAFNRWSFVNRGDLDGPWQMIRTWDQSAGTYLPGDKIEPEPIPYYGYGIITRFTAKHSAVLETESSSPGVVATALRSPDGNLTLIVLNNAPNDRSLSANLAGVANSLKLYCYQLTEAAVTRPDYQMDPMRQIEISAQAPRFNDQLPRSSITVYTTYHLTHAENGITLAQEQP